MRYDTILFDLDGTLLDTLGDLCAAVNHGLLSQGYAPATRDEVRQRIGNGSERLISLCLPGGREDIGFRAVFDSYYEYYLAHGSEETLPYPGIMELLTRLNASGAACAIITNKPDRAARELAARYFPGLIRATVGDRPGARRKPAPDAVLAAMRELNADPERTVYIGDSEVDIKTAANAGIPCISVSYGYRSTAELIENGAAVIAADVCELAALLLG